MVEPSKLEPINVTVLFPIDETKAKSLVIKAEMNSFKCWEHDQANNANSDEGFHFMLECMHLVYKQLSPLERLQLFEVLYDDTWLTGSEL